MDKEKLLKKLSNFSIDINFNKNTISDNNNRKIIINDNNIYIKFPYNKELVEKMRNLNQRKWNNNKKRWEANINKPNIKNLIIC